MNVLPFVFALLTLLSIMTYASLGSYFRSSAVDSAYACYIEHAAREQVNRSQKKLYDSLHGKGESDQERNEKIKAESKLNLELLIAPDEETSSFAFSLLGRLIEVLYREEPFYREELVASLIEEIKAYLAERSESGNRIASVEKISHAPLEQRDFWNALVRELSVKSEEFCSGKSPPPSLKKFMTLNKNSHPLRLQLMKRELLLAIFDDEELVNEIVAERYRLYREVLEDRLDRETASQEFEKQFRPMIPQEFPGKMFNFSISKSRPPSPRK